MSHIAELANLPVGLFRRLAQQPQHTAALSPSPSPQGYTSMLAADMDVQIRLWARGLMAAGIQPGDRVALMANNSAEWAMLDFAILAAGAVTVPIYPNYGAAETRFILEDSGATLLLAEDQTQLSTLQQAQISFPRLYLRDPDTAQQASLPTWADLKNQGQRTSPDLLDQRLTTLNRKDLASIVYTSGTSGQPRGVMLSHGNFLANIEGWSQVILLSAQDRLLSFLPLCHVYERCIGHFGAYLLGAEVAYAERPDSIIRDLPLAQPTVLISVPRLLQVIYNKTRREVAKKQGLLGACLRRGLGVNREGLSVPASGGPMGWLANKLMRRHLRRSLGGRLRFFVSGGAPLPKEIGLFFLRLGLPAVEGYGMTEASPVISGPSLSRVQPGSVGPAIPNVQLRIAEDGEILVRGPSISAGYWNNPTASAAVLADGWLHTGDVGRINTLGNLEITDRKKDLIINAAGENIAPQKIESRLTLHPCIDQAVVFGDRRPHLVALVYPSPEYVQMRLGKQNDKYAIRTLLRQAIDQALQGLPAYEQVRHFIILDSPLSAASGELTHTLKVKRKVLETRFVEDIDALYQTHGAK